MRTTNNRRSLKSAVWLLVLAGLALFGTASFAQVSVTATAGVIGPTTYPTLGSAFDAINIGTHQGAITVSILADTTEPTTASLNSSGPGGASYTSILVQPVGGPRTVTGSVVGAIIKLNGADNVTIDGRIAGTGRNLTVSNSNASADTAAIWLASVASGNGASNNVIRNLEIACGADQQAVTNATFGIIQTGTTISVTAVDGNDNDNNAFIANRIIRVRYGIVSRGVAGNNNIAPVITDNIIGPATFGPDQLGRVGIYMTGDTNALISRNTIQNVGSLVVNSVGGADRIGIAIGAEDWTTNDAVVFDGGDYTVTKNVIHDIVDEKTFSAVGIRLGTLRAGSPTNNLVANNFIFNIRANGTAGDQVVGIGYAGGSADRIVFNSISMTGDLDPAGATSASNFGNAIRVSQPNSSGNLNLALEENSIFLDVNSNTATVHYYAITLPNGNYAFGTGGLNVNNYFIIAANNQLRTGGLANTPGAAASNEFLTLSNWRAALSIPGEDLNSIQADPLYVSNTADLHLQPASLNVNVSTPDGVFGVTDDIDGQTRPTGAFPDIGADEVVLAPTPTPTPTIPPTPTPTPTSTPTPTPTPTSTPSSTPLQTPGITPTPTSTPTPGTPSPSPCFGTVFTENFDGVAAPALPAGWVSTLASGNPPLWTTSTTSPDTAPNDAFVNDENGVSDKTLDSPGIAIPTTTAQLSFRNNFNLQDTFDGGVLEVSSPNIAGGAFTDITNSAVGGSFVTGGYTTTINAPGSPIAGRMAWSGNSGGYIDTVVNLGATVSGQTIKLRFRIGTDSSVAAPGWRIDTIRVTTGPCPSPTPTPSPTVTPATPTPSPTVTPATPTPTPTTTPTPSPTPTPTPTPSPTPLTSAINISTRAQIQTGDGIGIGGFIIAGSAPKHVLLRAIGPSLRQFGFVAVLADPELELHGPGGFATIINNDWRDTQGNQILATGLAPTNDLESAIDATLAPGPYTTIVRGRGNTLGIGLVEIYDLSQGGASKLANLSTRAFVGTGENLVIAGFVLSNNAGQAEVIIRGLGPRLAAFGVPNVLANPILELHDCEGTLIFSNNDWRDDPGQAAIIEAAGLAPTNNLESAIAATLPPGPYTALLAGANNGVGIGLIEVYDRGNVSNGPLPPDRPPCAPTPVPGITPTPTPTPPPGSCNENFDGVTAPALPAGWVATNPVGPDPLWITSLTTPDTAPNDAVIKDPPEISDKRLETRNILITSAAAQLSFRNNFNLQNTFDGGVLEVSSPNIAGGAFTDITNASVGGTFVTGGYTSAINAGLGNPIGNRMAWSGNSGGYINTVVNLGPHVIGQTIKLRFRLGTDQALAVGGWRIDTISITGGSCP